jgi:prepilin-type N-terminal cleavage/methylation domain-containing protein
MLRIGRRAGENGFTVLELLVAMSLLAMVTIAVAMQLPDVSDRIAVGRAANLVEAELSGAASTAARTGRDQIVTLEFVDSSLRLRVGERTITLDPSLIASWTAAAEVGSSQSQGSIAFWGSGGASGGTFKVLRGRSQNSLEVDWLTAKVKRAR